MKEIDWQDIKVDTTQLELDLQNPRVPEHVKKHNDLGQIRNYLLKKENILKIARSIANNGYHNSAIAIVCKEENKLVVLDGNRRLAACQLLLNPALATNARDKEELENLNRILNKKQLKNIKITIAPSRKEAEKEIWDIHVNQLLKPWQVLQKLRMYRNLINSKEYNIDLASSEYGIAKTKFKQELAKLYFYELILGELRTDKEEEELLNSGFNKIDRLILSGNGRKLLGYKFDNKGEINIEDKKNFDEKFNKLIPYIVEKNKVAAQATQETLEEEVFSVIDPVKFHKKTATPPTKKTEGSKTTKQHKNDKPKTSTKPDWITNNEYLEYKGAERVKKMLQEMKNLEPKYNENILLVSLRVLLESALYHKLMDKGHIENMVTNYKNFVKANNTKQRRDNKPITLLQKNWSPSFREMLKYILDDSNKVIQDPQSRDALEKIVRGETNFVEDLNIFIHNVRYTPTKGDSEKIWCKFGRFLFDIIYKI